MMWAVGQGPAVWGMSDVERYRKAAERMRACGVRSSTPEIARGYRELALQWDALARQAAAGAIGTDPRRQADERPSSAVSGVTRGS